MVWLGVAALGCDDDEAGPSTTEAMDSADTGMVEVATDSDTAAAASSSGDEDSTGEPPPGGLGDQCDQELDNCEIGLRCLFGLCTWACGDAPMCCPDGMICGGIEYECRLPAEDWCGDPCDGQAWHACEPGETCLLDADGTGTCTPQ